MAMPPQMEVITRAQIMDRESREELTNVIVGVYPEEGGQYTGLNVLWLIERTERCTSEEDIPDWKQTLAGLLHNAAVPIFQRFSLSNNARDLDIVITLHRKVVALTPVTHPDYPKRMFNLATFIEDRYNSSGNTADLDHIIGLLRTVLFDWTIPPFPFPPLGAWYYGYLADTISLRYNALREEEDVEEVIALRRKVVELTPSPAADHTNAVRSLSHALVQRFRIYKEDQDFDEVIRLQRAVLNLTNETERMADLFDLTEAVFARFSTASECADDVKEMIGFYEQLIRKENAETPGQNAEVIRRHLASVTNERFRRTGNIDDLDRAISLELEALELQGPNHPQRHSSLVMLGPMLRSKFILTGQRKSLEEAISCVREALKLVPNPHADRPMVLNNLSIILRRAFEEYGEYEFLREAIELEEEALRLPPTTKENRITSLGNLATAHLARYRSCGGADDDLNASISLYEKALNQMTEKHPSYPFIVGNLATLLGLQLEKKPHLKKEDLDKSMELIRVSLAAFGDIHPENCTMTMNLGVACLRMYNLSKRPEDLEEGIAAFRCAARHSTAPASQKFLAAKTWAKRAEELEDSSALEAYRTAIDLLPLLVALNSDLEARQQRLKSNVAHTDGLGVSAAGYALKAGLVGDAIEFLEEGRALFWTQALKLRSPIGDLALMHPELAERFRSISKKLEMNSFNNTSQYDDSSVSSPTPALSAHHQDSVRLGRLQVEWDVVLAEIRQQPGFETFLQRHSSSHAVLQKLEHALDGPVIMLCFTRRISGAIIMTANDKKYLQLPHISLTEVLNLGKLMRCVRTSGGSRDSDILSDSALQSVKELYREALEPEVALENDILRKGPAFGPKPPSTSSLLRHVLRELWVKIGLPIIQFLELKQSESPLRVYWCPTGPSTFLPIHAAGIYDDCGASNTSESLSDYIISSYVPTIGALINTSRDRALGGGINSQQKILAIVQPKSLPSALDELEKIETRLSSGSGSEAHPKRLLVKLGDRPSNPATISSVLNQLSTSSVVHFACHGKQIEGNPLDSGLILEDGKLTVSRIMQLEMKNAHLAFLCACETAMGEKEVPDESMHIGGALLFSGFKGVVATMWSIADIDGPKIADEFYGRIFDDKEENQKEERHVNSRDPARALHDSVLKLRAQGAPLQRWVPFVYLGR